MPEAIAITPLRTASLPVAQAFSTRVTGMSVRSRVSARIPDGNPSVVDSSPNQAASISDLEMPLSTLATASAYAIGTRSLMPSSKCSPNGVIPAPTIATRLISGNSFSAARPERVSVIRDARPHRDAPKHHRTRLTDRRLPRRHPGHLQQYPHRAAVELHHSQ